LSPNDAVQQSGGLKDLGIFGKSIDDNSRGDAKRELRMDSICCSAHGLSLLITGVKDGERHSILFDTGPEEHIFELNAKRLRAPLETIEAIQLSHWHRDHSGGMLKVLSMAYNAKGTSSPPINVDLHPDRPDFRGVMAMAPVSLEADPTFAEIESAGGKVDKRNDAHTVGHDYFLVSGEIPRTTAYEVGLRRGIRFVKEKGVWEDDTLIKDERFLMCKLKGMA
jgi:7,8-dihydropterin-6-yl-methyl-4-(beta-D-ribofuranosyl)aminobenzene 5'-phosphate synthase